MDIPAIFTLSYGLFIVTADDGERKDGCVVNTVFQITAEPIQIAVSVSKANKTHETIVKKGSLSVTVLGEDFDQMSIGTFGYRSGRDLDKFAGRVCKEDCNGNPTVGGGVAEIAATVVGSQDLGSHTVFFCKVDDMSLVSDVSPMTYRYYREVRKGTSPKNAPTHVEAK